MATLTLTVDGLARTVTTAEGAGTIRHVVLGFHGSGASGETFLRNWGDPAPEWAVMAPDALIGTTAGESAWVVPGLPPDDQYYPAGAPSDLHDMNLVAALIADAQARYPDATIYYAGNSKGASLGWACYAHSVEGITAYWLGIFGAPMSDFYTNGPNAWGFAERLAARLFEPRHVALWHGDVPFDVKSQADGGADLWLDSAILLGQSVASSGYDDWTEDFGAVRALGTTYTVRLRRGVGGRKIVREYNVVDGGHWWSEGESAYARAFFTAASMPLE